MYIRSPGLLRARLRLQHILSRETGFSGLKDKGKGVASSQLFCCFEAALFIFVYIRKNGITLFNPVAIWQMFFYNGCMVE